MVRLFILILLFLSCRYRYNFGIYVPLENGLLYTYTSRYVDNGEYESPSGKNYRPDTLFIIGDTNFNGINAKKVYVRKQNASFISRDTSIYYILADTLFARGKISSLMVPFFKFNYTGAPYVGEPTYSDTFITAKLLRITADVGEAWKVGDFSGNLKVYRDGFGDVPDSVRIYSVSGEFYGRLEGFEDLDLPYGKVERCALVIYDLKVVISSIPIEIEAFRTWWCPNIGQSAYTMTASQFRNERKIRMELADLELR